VATDIGWNHYWVREALTVVRPRVVVIECNVALLPPAGVAVAYDADRWLDGTGHIGTSLSREYRRTLGAPPRRNVTALKVEAQPANFPDA
jgi:hypothetical protein